MGVPTSEVGYTPAMPRREDHEVHKGHVVALGEEKKNLVAQFQMKPNETSGSHGGDYYGPCLIE